MGIWGVFSPEDVGGTEMFQLEILSEKGNQRDAHVLFRINLSLQAKGLTKGKDNSQPAKPADLWLAFPGVLPPGMSPPKPKAGAQ